MSNELRRILSSSSIYGLLVLEILMKYEEIWRKYEEIGREYEEIFGKYKEIRRRLNP